MRGIRKSILQLFFVCLNAVVLGGCRYNTSGKVTQMPTPTLGAEGEKVITVATKEMGTSSGGKEITLDAEETPGGLVPICEEYFSSVTFREFISSSYDLDQDGYLSLEERQAVSLMILQYGFDGECLNGFEHFSNLSSLYVTEGAHILVQNHPSLRYLQVEHGEFDEMRVTNCTGLETVEFVGCEGKRVQVEECPKLQELILDKNEIETISVIETPNVHVCLANRVNFNQMVLDRNVTLEFVSEETAVFRSGMEEFSHTEYVSVEEFVADTEIEWVGEKREQSTGDEENNAKQLEIENTFDITPIPEMAEVPVTEEYFSNADFRAVILAKFDRDKNGTLSMGEREVVTELVWGGPEFEDIEASFDDAVLDGLGWFPKLESIDVKYADKVVLVNHPSIKSIGGDTGGTELFVKNCPMLENIGFSYFGGSVVIRDCENLKRFSAYQTSFDTLSFLGTPQLVVGLEGSKIKTIQVDADVIVETEEYTKGLKYVEVAEDGSVELKLKNRVEWENIAEQSLKIEGGFFEVSFEEADVFNMEVQISEDTESRRDAQGRTLWRVCIIGKEPDAEEKVFLVYSKEKPEREQIVFRPTENTNMEVLECSPNRVLSFAAQWDFDVVYHDGEDEEALGSIRSSQWWTLYPDGTKRLYHSMKEWRDSEGYVFARNQEYGG